MAVIFHIDVNSAFLSWSAAARAVDETHPDLRTIPSIIGGDEKSRHGIVLAKSELAKSYGVRTGEPIASALKKCPFLTILPPDRSLYRSRSAQLMELLNTYTSDLEQLSIDECFLDFTPIAHRFPSYHEGAREIQNRIRHELGFTVNIGISSNRLLAKMASDFEKPNRIHTLFPEEIPLKMWPLPVEDLFMVGRSSSSRLHELGIHTIGELAHSDQDFLISHFKSHGRQMWNYANGIASDVITADKPTAKGIGNSVTLSADVSTSAEARKVLLQLSETVSARLRKAKKMAGSVTVEIKYHDFISVSHQTGLPAPIDTTSALYDTACTLFEELWNGSPIRLLGIRTTKLQEKGAPVQLSLFDPMFAAPEEKIPPRISREKQQRLEAAMDSIRKKYGKEAVVRGSFLKKP